MRHRLTWEVSNKKHKMASIADFNKFSSEERLAVDEETDNLLPGPNYSPGVWGNLGDSEPGHEMIVRDELDYAVVGGDEEEEESHTSSHQRFSRKISKPSFMRTASSRTNVKAVYDENKSEEIQRSLRNYKKINDYTWEIGDYINGSKIYLSFNFLNEIGIFLGKDLKSSVKKYTSDSFDRALNFAKVMVESFHGKYT